MCAWLNGIALRASEEMRTEDLRCALHTFQAGSTVLKSAEMLDDLTLSGYPPSYLANGPVSVRTVVQPRIDAELIIVCQIN